MIESSDYIRKISIYFGFLITEFNFKLLEAKVRANVFYDIQFKNNERIISISYENIEDYLLVTVFKLQNGEMPNYDDKTKTLHLNQINKLIFSKVSLEEIICNASNFYMFKALNELDRKLLKEAKELRLYLKHFNEL